MRHLYTGDYIVFFIYFIAISAYGYYIYHKKKASAMSTKDFFLAEGSLTWWAIGASLIASNISAEHFIGMSGSGYLIGLAISSYEWMAAATLVIVAVFLIPMYLKNRIYTMPQFLARRYSDQVSTIMAVFWLLVYVLVNLTSIIYLGALAISSISDKISFEWAIVGLSVFSIIVTLGGMKVIGYTDVVQVLVLIIGGLVTTYLALSLLADKFGFDGNIWKALGILRSEAPDHFHMVLDKSSPHYKELPGVSVLIGGMLVNNLAYWGCNQYIVQRALGADLKTARKGILFAAFLKLLIPIIAVLPGITMYVMHEHGMFHQEMLVDGHVKPDNAYPTLMNLLPEGLKGMAFAALTAAIVASLAGKSNSISTIFSLDIYKKFINKEASDRKVVRVGRWAVIISMVIAAIITPALKSLDQAYQFIQEYVGFLSPGVLAIFLLGMFWRRTTAPAALAGAILTIPISTVLKFLPAWSGGAFPDFPFLDRMTITFFAVAGIMVLVSLVRPAKAGDTHTIEMDTSLFRVTPGFVVGSLIICGILAALYTVYW